MNTGSPSLWPLAWFLIVVALIPVSLWLVKRSPLGARLGATPLGASASMKTVGTLALGPGQRVVTVEVGTGAERRWLVLGVTAQQITTLHLLDAPPREAADDTGAALPPPSFASLFAGLRRDRGTTPPGAA